jgi:hypothetical protein
VVCRSRHLTARINFFHLLLLCKRVSNVESHWKFALKQFEAPAPKLQSACILDLEHNVRSATVTSQSTPAPNVSWYSVLLQTSQLCASMNKNIFFGAVVQWPATRITKVHDHKRL